MPLLKKKTPKLLKPQIGYKVQVTDYRGQKAMSAEEVVSSPSGALRLVAKNLAAGTRGIVVFPTREKVTAKSVEMAQAAIEVRLMGFPQPDE